MKKLSLIDSVYQKSAHLAEEVADKSKWSLLFAPFVYFFERFIFNDWNFLQFLAVLVAVDTLLGFGHAVYRKEVNVSKAGGLLIKAIIYGPILILGHVFENFEVSGNRMEGGYYLKVLFYTGLIIVEGISIIRNAGKISKKLVPKFILKRFEDFNESGDFQGLTGKSATANTDFQSPDGDDFSPYLPKKHSDEHADS